MNFVKTFSTLRRGSRSSFQNGLDDGWFSVEGSVCGFLKLNIYTSPDNNTSTLLEKAPVV
jgi:hypothetical protein